MAKVKTSELIDAALDWAVGVAEGRQPGAYKGVVRATAHPDCPDSAPMFGPELNYSTDPAQAVPIIDREITKVFRNVSGTWSAMILKDVPIPSEDRGTSLALTRRAQWNGAGPTPLIAAMRCYVTLKLGDTVEVPDELLERTTPCSLSHPTNVKL